MLERALAEEMTGHLGYEKHDPVRADVQPVVIAAVEGFRQVRVANQLADYAASGPGLPGSGRLIALAAGDQSNFTGR